MGGKGTRHIRSRRLGQSNCRSHPRRPKKAATSQMTSSRGRAPGGLWHEWATTNLQFDEVDTGKGVRRLLRPKAGARVSLSSQRALAYYCLTEHRPIERHRSSAKSGRQGKCQIVVSPGANAALSWTAMDSSWTGVTCQCLGHSIKMATKMLPGGWRTGLVAVIRCRLWQRG